MVEVFTRFGLTWNKHEEFEMSNAKEKKNDRLVLLAHFSFLKRRRRQRAVKIMIAYPARVLR